MYDEMEALFARHFVKSSSLCEQECACGRVHFTSACGHGDYDEGALAQLKELAEAKADKYVEIAEYNHIEYAVINGQTIVIDCVCGKAKKLAAFLVGHADECASLLLDLMNRRMERASNDEIRYRIMASRLSLWTQAKHSQ